MQSRTKSVIRESTTRKISIEHVFTSSLDTLSLWGCCWLASSLRYWLLGPRRNGIRGPYSIFPNLPGFPIARCRFHSHVCQNNVSHWDIHHSYFWVSLQSHQVPTKQLVVQSPPIFPIHYRKWEYEKLGYLLHRGRDIPRTEWPFFLLSSKSYIIFSHFMFGWYARWIEATLRVHTSQTSQWFLTLTTSFLPTRRTCTGKCTFCIPPLPPGNNRLYLLYENVQRGWIISGAREDGSNKTRNFVHLK